MKEKRQNTFSALAHPLKLERLIRMTGQKHIFPFYHTVSPEPLPHLSHLYRVLTPDEFERDLDQLLRFYAPMSLADYLEGRSQRNGRPAMVLSFDDGLKGCHDYLAPLLQKKGIPAVFFLNNRFIGNRGLFYRYKAGLLIHKLEGDGRIREKLADFLKISGEQLEASIRMISWDQRTLLDALANQAGLDFSGYLRDNPVYLTEDEVRALLARGFDVGAHSAEHMEFTGLDPRQMEEQVRSSVADLQKRFRIVTAYFSFPFTSDGVPLMVIDGLLSGENACALFGTAGLKQTGRRSYIQRIPMDEHGSDALDTLKAEYLYYLLKMLLGRNRLRY